MKKATTSIVLDTRRAFKDGTYPVKLRVTFRRQQKYYTVPCSITETYSLPNNYSFSEEEFVKTQSVKPRGIYKDIQTDLQAYEGLASDIIKKLQVFTFDAFEKQLNNAAATYDVFSAFDKQIEKLIMEGRVGTAKSYESASFSLLSYTCKAPLLSSKGLTLEEAKIRKDNILNKRKQLPFFSVSVEFLQEYEQWMQNRGNSMTTIGMYLRALRALFNDAIAVGEVNPEFYPFGKRKYQIPAGRNVKKALSLSDIEKIFNYKPVHDSEARARDLWIFSYLCNGINIKDIALLRYSNIDSSKITFIRSKTKRTSRQNLHPVVVILSPDLKGIIERWGNKPRTSSGYVFPLLSEGLTPEKELARIKQAIKNINTYIKRIASAVGIEKEVTTYTARHSFSTVLKRGGASIAEISEALGHKDLKTTESYLDSFEDDTKRRHSSMLTAFKQKPLNEELQ